MRMTHEYPDYSALVNGAQTLTIGDQGLQLFSEPHGACEATDAPKDPLPSTGWRCVSYSYENTGGGCMVDFYLFDNGHRLTVNEECAVLWPPMSVDAFEEVFYNDPEQYIAVIDWEGDPCTSTK